MNVAFGKLAFVRSFLFVLAGGVVVGYWLGGLSAAYSVAVLAVFEITMSFDNAVINATVLQRMNRYWQHMFLTVGLVIAVLVMRLVLPVVIVASTAHLGLSAVTNLALHHPEQYKAALTEAKPAIAGFGFMFLLMIFLNFMMDGGKRVHWIRAIERPLSRLGRLKLLSVAVSLAALEIVARTVGLAQPERVVAAGLTGLFVYLLVRVVSAYFESVSERSGHPVGLAAFSLFMYLEVLDSSFSFDGVIGAFAITGNVLVIALGLGIGALFIRQLTVVLVRNNTLKDFIYLEHGAHYSIGVLALVLAVGLAYNVPEVVTGFLGVGIILASLVASMQARG